MPAHSLVQDVAKVCSDIKSRNKFIKMISDASYPTYDRKLLLWAMIDVNLFKEVITVWEHMVKPFKELDDGIDKILKVADNDTLIGSILGYARLGDLTTVIELLLTIPLKKSIMFDLIVQAACSGQKLKIAEEIIKLWLKKYISFEQNPFVVDRTRTLIRDMESRIRNHHSPSSSSSQPSAYDGSSSLLDHSVTPALSELLNELADSDLVPIMLPSIDTWESLIVMYSERNAWIEMRLILQYLRDIYDSDPNGTIVPQSKWFLEDSSRLYFSGDRVDKRMYNLHVRYIRCLCSSAEYGLATAVVRELYERGHDVELSILEPFVGVFLSDLADDSLTTSNITSQRLIQVSDLVTHMVEKVMDSEVNSIQTAKQLGGYVGADYKNTHSRSDNEVASMQLIFQSVMKTLCRKGLPDISEKMLARIRELEKITGLNILQKNSDVYTGILIEGHRYANKEDSCNKAIQLYKAHEELMKNNPSEPALSSKAYHDITGLLFKHDHYHLMAEFMVKFETKRK